ncbi:MAG: GNAT family N-acetyltransferase [Clostridiales bacterium]|jgi:L-amino acid N-acyltransferase YncA|nr:GNAT family N-acetyltransferase [Clostridiales bacterium]
MIKLSPDAYDTAAPLVQDSRAELSVAATLGGYNPGEVWVDDAASPHAAVIRTTETTAIAGDAAYTPAYDGIRALLGYWENVFPDTSDWEEVIPRIHPNPYLTRYMRRQYKLYADMFRDWSKTVPDGYTLERLEDAHFTLENGDTVRKWAAMWGSTARFLKEGAGYVIRQDDTLCAWSLTDCRMDERAAIGIVVDSRHRRRGLAACVSSATAAYWLAHGVTELQWLCIAANAGSQATAKKLGFTLACDYPSFTTYPPYENDSDQTPEQWKAWGERYRDAPACYDGVRERCKRLAGQMREGV